jgi:branched-chain amino acid transport system substrate-binding protein
VRYVVQGNGSSVALALVDAINKHNERNPGKEVLYLNDSAVDPDLTNSKCSYWHFRFDADTSMKMEAMTTFIKDQPRRQEGLPAEPELLARRAGGQVRQGNLARKRPDIQIVGEDLHPLAQSARLRALHRQDQGLGCRHGDHRQLGLRPVAAGQGANEGGYNGKFFTYYAGVTGTPTALGTNGAGRVYQIAYNHYNMGGQMEVDEGVQAKYNDDFYTGSVIRIL